MLAVGKIEGNCGCRGVDLLLKGRLNVKMEVIDEIDRCVVKEMMKWWQRCKLLLGRVS